MNKNHTITQVISDKLSDDELAALLPPQVVDIAQFIGYSKALLLVKGMGGVDFAVPRGLTKNRSEREQRLIDAIGVESAKKFMAVFGGERLYVPPAVSNCCVSCVIVSFVNVLIVLSMVV